MATEQRDTDYTYGDSTRQKFTGYERGEETGLDFAQARYYNSQHGRFTSVDPLTASANVKDPQTFNRYSYVLNSPYKFTDPLGLLPVSSAACGQWCPNRTQGIDGSQFSSRYTIPGTEEWGKQDGYTPAQDILESFAETFEKVREWQDGRIENELRYTCPRCPRRRSRRPNSRKTWKKGAVTVAGEWTVGRRQQRRSRNRRSRSKVKPLNDPRFPNARDHWRGHAPNGWSLRNYFEHALWHTRKGNYGFRQSFSHGGQKKWAYVTRTGSDSFIFTSTSRDGRTVFTHMILSRDGNTINGQYLRNLGIKVTSYPKNFIGPIGANGGRNE